MQIRGDYHRAGYAHLEALVPTAVTHELLALVKGAIDTSGAQERLMTPQPQLRRPALEIYGYEHAPTLTFAWGLTPAISEVVGRELLPTYSYFRVYREGDVCLVHSDRDACEHSLSLTLAYSDGKAWPLEIGGEKIERASAVADDFGGADFASVPMQPGDAVLYQGIRYRHGRTTPNPNRWSAHMFLHWVDRDGPYKSHAFDGRAAAGKIDFG